MEKLLTVKEWKNLRARVLERDDYTCTYCGANGCVLCADHIVPFAQYGKDTMDNLTTACRSCNARKGSRTPEQWRKGEWPQHKSPRKNFYRFRDEKVSISVDEFDAIELRLNSIGTTFRQMCLDAGIQKGRVTGWLNQRRVLHPLTGSKKNMEKLTMAFNKLVSEKWN